MSLGWQVLAAARAQEAGATVQEMIVAADKVRAKLVQIVCLNTLEFLHRGGRIGGAQRLLGSALSMKPILTIKDGKVDPAGSVRTSAKVFERVVEMVAEKCAGKTNVRLATLHANAEENAKAVLRDATEKLKAVESILSAVSPAIGTHTGPGTVGLAYCTGV